MERMLKGLEIGIIELEGLFQEQSNLDAANAGQIYQNQVEDCKALETLLSHACVSLAIRRPSTGPAGVNGENVPRVLILPTEQS